MFDSQPNPDIHDHANRTIPASCPSNLGLSKWLMFFEWNEEVEKPFQLFSSTHFGKEIKENWIRCSLSMKAREKKLLLEGKSMSLFGKILPSKYFLQINYIFFSI